MVLRVDSTADPFDVECAVCSTILPADLPHTRIRVADDMTVTDLCVKCATIAIPAFERVNRLVGFDQGDTPPVTRVLLWAQLESSHPLPGRDKRTANRLLEREGWSKRDLRLFGRSRRRLLAEGCDLFLGARGLPDVACRLCGEPGGAMLLSTRLGLFPLCDRCGSMVAGFADAGWMDEGEPPDAGNLLVWASRFMPEDAERIIRNAMTEHDQDDGEEDMHVID